MLNTRPVSSLQDLALTLRDALQARSDKTIFVKADGTVPYGRVVEAMDVARGAGAERIGIVCRHGQRLAPLTLYRRSAAVQLSTSVGEGEVASPTSVLTRKRCPSGATS